ncbi:MAG TPA: hypothetical protein VER03_23025, partial [Bryobacteraceae bacterium]|nr:hypothetical protein [Bryobacteraceae bacterium]
MLPTGRRILTVAHNFFDSSGNPALAATATFHLPSSSSIIGASSVNVHNTFNGNLLNGGDIAVITLAQDAPVQATRFDIYRGGSEVGETIEKSGYGRTGTGFTGSTLASGAKRDGLNRVDVLGEPLNGTVCLLVSGRFWIAI